MAEMIILVLAGWIFFWLWMFCDCLRHERGSIDRTIWLSLMVLMNIVGAFSYLVLRYRTNRQPVPVAETEDEDSGTENVVNSKQN